MIIGFCGLARAGKTAAAWQLLDEFDGHAVRLCFAAPVKAAVDAIGLDRDLDGHLWRQAAQVIGHEIRQQVQSNFWVKNMERRVSHCPGVVIIDDVRYEDEIDLCDKKIYIDASKRLDMREPVYAHPSEQVAREICTALHDHDRGGHRLLDKVDYVVDNNHDEETFRANLEKIFEELVPSLFDGSGKSV